MNPIIIIPARMASTRLPGKPMALIAEQPMVLHVVDRAREAQIGPVVVACCEQEVADAAREHDAYAIMTDPALPSGSDRVHAALAEYDPEGEFDVVINLQGDLPLVNPYFIRALADVLAEESFDLATLVAPVRSEEEACSPHVVKAVCSGASALYFSRARVPSGPGPLWHHIGIYAWRPQTLARFVALGPSPLELREKLEQLRALEAGMRIGVAYVDHAPSSVDTEADLRAARLGHMLLEMDD